MAKKQAKTTVFKGEPATVSFRQLADGIAVDITQPCQSVEEIDELLALYAHYIEEARKLPGWKPTPTEKKAAKAVADLDEEKARRHAATKTRHSVKKRGS